MKPKGRKPPHRIVTVRNNVIAWLIPRMWPLVWMLAAIYVAHSLNVTAAGQQPAATSISPGTRVDLLKRWPTLSKAPKADLATIEMYIRPDEAALSRARSFLVILSNSGGSDVASVGLALHAGKVTAGILGTKLVSSSRIGSTDWTHVALTINTRTINKQARLWIDGELVDESLVLHYWPDTFQVGELLYDRWGQNRSYSGLLGDVRISNRVRYDRQFVPPPSLELDELTVFHLDGNDIPSDSEVR